MFNAYKYYECQMCGTKEIPHKAKGLCLKCYAKFAEQRYKSGKQNDRGSSKKILTEEYLREQYIMQQKSIGNIAQEIGCSRQYIMKILKEYNFPIRSKTEARKLALQQEKIIVNGEKFQYTYYDENFFKVWTKEMAYILGIIITDGSMNPTRMSVDISQKDKKFLNNLSVLLKTNSKINKKDQIPNAIYTLSLSNKEIYNDIIKLGIHPNKSLNMEYLDVPVEFESHFIRGIWDGNGTIYKDNKYYRTKIVSGSEQFIIKLAERLNYYGINTNNIYHKDNYYSLEIYTIINNLKTFRDFLYKDTDNLLIRLERKYKLFLEI